MVFETMVEVAMLGMHRWLARGAGLMPSFSEKKRSCLGSYSPGKVCFYVLWYCKKVVDTHSNF